MHLCITDLALVFSVADYNEGVLLNDDNNDMSSHSQNTIENTKT